MNNNPEVRYPRYLHPERPLVAALLPDPVPRPSPVWMRSAALAPNFAGLVSPGCNAGLFRIIHVDEP
jgi:hypothetical protein